MGLETDRKVAERLGWAHVEDDSWWEENRFDTYNLKGLSGYNPVSLEREPVPFFSTDVNAAITLIVKRFQLELSQSSNDDRGKWLAKYLDHDYKAATYAWGDNPAEAICIAWLNLRDQIDADKFASQS